MDQKQTETGQNGPETGRIVDEVDRMTPKEWVDWRLRQPLARPPVTEVPLTVFMVEKRAVYKHGIYGVFATEPEARACAEAATSAPITDDNDWCHDGDGHHAFFVMAAGIGGGIRDVAMWGLPSRVARTERGVGYVWKDL